MDAVDVAVISTRRRRHRWWRTVRALRWFSLMLTPTFAHALSRAATARNSNRVFESLFENKSNNALSILLLSISRYQRVEMTNDKTHLYCVSFTKRRVFLWQNEIESIRIYDERYGASLEASYGAVHLFLIELRCVSECWFQLHVITTRHDLDLTSLRIPVSHGASVLSGM